MKCPECVKEGKTSIVLDPGYGVTTAMCVHAYWDEDGKRHVHNPNTRTVHYSCSNGHDWVDSRRGSCWCGWGKEDG